MTTSLLPLFAWTVMNLPVCSEREGSDETAWEVKSLAMSNNASRFRGLALVLPNHVVQHANFRWVLQDASGLRVRCRTSACGRSSPTRTTGCASARS